MTMVLDGGAISKVVLIRNGADDAEVISRKIGYLWGLPCPVRTVYPGTLSPVGAV